MKTQTWQGHPIEYVQQAIPQNYDGVVLVKSTAYPWDNGDLRYVAIRNGLVIAVQTKREGFCNMCVNPCFDGGMRGYFPDFVHTGGKISYRVPVVDLA